MSNEEENYEADSAPEEPDSERTIPMGSRPVDSDTPAAGIGTESPFPSGWTPPSPEELDPLFPDFEILELIGRGGMGAVYKGEQKKLKRAVAIKLLPPEIAEADPSFANRFKNEARAMAQLDHPNIVHVYDFGQTETGQWFIVMEFVDGPDFHHLIRSGELEPKQALQAVSQICDALEYAHDQGYVHRDIKPANIFINRKGTLKVGDFGLAKMIKGNDKKEESILTMTGYSVGTPAYCAPEQLSGVDVDNRADIYSLGVMFYEMLTRELPRGNFPPPSKKVEIDVRIDDVVLRAMESERERRYSSVTEMRTEIGEIQNAGLKSQSIGNGKGSANRNTSIFKKVCWTVSTFLIVAVTISLIAPPWFNGKFMQQNNNKHAQPVPSRPNGSQLSIIFKYNEIYFVERFKIDSKGNLVDVKKNSESLSWIDGQAAPIKGKGFTMDRDRERVENILKPLVRLNEMNAENPSRFIFLACFVTGDSTESFSEFRKSIHKIGGIKHTTVPVPDEFIFRFSKGGKKMPVE